ncbi:PREDICTED: ankyrin repeat-containing protein At3g12360-like isoform X1 [Populus euphratica]|uniref:Ankyrin repeat-containing protein At3g12360-like isoform X1 n=1 Tax=Populus euphratica TaxID=75702 RepID=A0AAJ6XLT6_POPEU|nr:PREDICTED: ankyrin repeat-containing protein At3g12360-like isoform X1 [Populus euphratica]
MDPRLLNAALTGDVNALLELIREDPLLLHAVTVTTSNTPLHIAALLGHAQFAMVAMQNCPGLADELNQQGFSPIHLASAKGHWEIVRDMLVRRPDLALIKDEDGKNPLHTAATKGRVQVLREVFSIESAQELTPKGENALHVAVKHNQYKALETLIQLAYQIQVGDELVNAKDEDGNTVLHLAGAAKNSKQIVRLLVSDQTNVEVNAVNSEGLTALDICVTSMAGSNELEEIQEVLRSAGAEVSRLDQAVVSNQRQQALAREDRSSTSRNEKYTDSLRNGIGVLAVLFSTISFQLGMNPPGGSWQDWASSTNHNFPNVTHMPGKSIIWELQKSESLTFFKLNALCFFSSLTTLVFLALTEFLNYSGLYAFNKNQQRYWNFLLHALFGCLLVSAAEEFIRGMALVTDNSVAYISSKFVLKLGPRLLSFFCLHSLFCHSAPLSMEGFQGE